MSVLRVEKVVSSQFLENIEEYGSKATSCVSHAPAWVVHASLQLDLSNTGTLFLISFVFQSNELLRTC